MHFWHLLWPPLPPNMSQSMLEPPYPYPISFSYGKYVTSHLHLPPPSLSPRYTPNMCDVIYEWSLRPGSQECITIRFRQTFSQFDNQFVRRSRSSITRLSEDTFFLLLVHNSKDNKISIYIVSVIIFLKLGYQ